MAAVSARREPSGAIVPIAISLFVVLLGSQCAADDITYNINIIEYHVELTFADDLSVIGSVDIPFSIPNNTYNKVELKVLWGPTLYSGMNSTDESPKNEDFVIVSSDTSTSYNYSSTSMNLNESTRLLTVEFQCLNDSTPINFLEDSYTMTISFHVKPNPNDVKGLFIRKFQNENSASTGVVVSTDLWPNNAHLVFPCYYNNLNPKVSLKLVRPTSWTFAAASLDTVTTNATTDTTTDIFTQSSDGNINLNAFGFALGKNMVGTEMHSSKKTTLNFFSNVKSSVDNSTFQETLSSLAGYYDQAESLVGLGHPLKKITIILVPDLPKPFASFGIIYIRDDPNYGNYGTLSEGRFRSLVVPVIYEYFRQFTEFSTRPSTWGDEWLSQAMATFLQYSLLNSINSPYNFRDDIDVVIRQSALGMDSSNSIPLQTPMSNLVNMNDVEFALMDQLKKLKGASILTMANRTFPAGSIEKATTQFLTKNMQTDASASTFFATLINIAKSTDNSFSTNVLDKFSLWSQSSGYPLLSLTSSNSTSIAVTLVPPSTSADYLVPVTVSSNTVNQQQYLWLSSNSTTSISLNNSMANGWVVANQFSTGYYRANYSAQNWQNIVSALASGDKSLVNYTHLIDDAFAFAMAEQSLNSSIPLTMAVYVILNNEVLFKNWFPVYNGLSRISDNLREGGNYTNFTKFMTPFLMKLNSLLKSGKLNTIERNKISSLFYDQFCTFGIGNYADVTAAYQLLNGSQPSLIPSSSYDSLVCCGAQNSSTLQASVLWSTVQNINMTYNIRHYSSVAIGCLSNYTDIRSTLVEMVKNTDPTLNSYITTTIWYLSEKHPSQLLADLASNNGMYTIVLQNRLGVATAAAIVSRVSSKLTSTDDTNNLAILYNGTAVDQLVQNTSRAAAKAVTARTYWLSRNKGTLLQSLATATQKLTYVPNTNSATSITLSLFVFLPLYSLFC